LSADRKTQALSAIERALVRDRPDLGDGALDYLLAEAANLLEVKSYVLAGDGLDVGGAVAALKRSEIGKLVYAEQHDASDPKTAQREALTRLSGAERIAYARKHGLA